MQSTFVIISLCFGVASAAVWTEPIPKTPTKFEGQEGCYLERDNKVVPYFSTMMLRGQCIRLYCGEMLEYTSCDVPSINRHDNCIITEIDIKKTFPLCCPQKKCF